MFFVVPMLLTLAAATGPGDSLRAAQTDALAAVEGDTVERVRSRWLESSAGRLGLAWLSLFRYDFPDAEQRFRSIETDPASPAALRIHAAFGLARWALARGNAAAADSAFDALIPAAHAAGLLLLEADALLSRTLTIARLRGPAAALPTLARADRLIPRDEPSLRSRALCIRSQLSRSTNLEAAAGYAFEGWRVARNAGNPRQEGACLAQAGWAVALGGSTDSALALFKSGAALQLRARDLAGRAATLQWLGYFLFDYGYYGEARTVLEQALTDGTRSGNLSPVGWAHITLARLTFVTGELDQVASHIAKAESLFARQGDASGHYALAGPAVERARATGDTAAARRAVERYARDASTWGGVWPTEAHRSMAMVLADRGEWDAARVQLDSAIIAARSMGSPGYVATVQQDLGGLALRRGDPRTALGILEPLFRNMSGEQGVVRHYSLIQLADAYLGTGDVPRAARLARDAADELDRWRAGVSDRRLLQAAFDLRPLEDPNLALADIISGLAAAGQSELAFELAERRRARYLLDRMVLADGLRDHPEGTGRPRTPMVSLADVQQSIPDDATAVVEFVRGRPARPTTVFVVTRASLHAIQLPPAPDLGRRVRRLIGLLEAGTSADSLAASLGDELLAPVLRILPGSVTRLVMVPDLELHGLPLEALRVGGAPLVQRFAISYSPSAGVAARLWQRPRRTGPVTMLAMGDSRFALRPEAGSSAEVYFDAFGLSGGLGRLPESAREARAVAAYADGADVRIGSDASEAELKRPGLSDYRIVHLATHALVDDRSVTRTALALTPGDGQDGFVSPSEIAELKFGADLVVLSACRTGRGPVAGGEGVLGLAAPALEAGARAILTSGWLVNDRQTAGFMTRYYGELARGHSLGEALHRTKLALIREGAPPAVWAAFTLTGDVTTMLPLHQPAPRWPRGILVVGALMLGGMLYGAMRRLRGREGASRPSGSTLTTSQR